MKLSDFDYELPEELIAQEPTPERDAARLLAHDIPSNHSEHCSIRDLGRFLVEGDLLVLNDTRVLPARLFGRRPTGARVELLFVEPVPNPPGGSHAEAWRVLCNPARRIRPGELLEIDGGVLHARAIERCATPGGEPGPEWIVELTEVGAAGDGQGVVELLARHGTMPLPPYIRRDPGAEGDPSSDRDRYQTVFAERPGAIAAPTAGLHFTPELLEGLIRRGIEIAKVTLHVGLGTFQPVQVERIEEHRMHRERFSLSEETADRVREVRGAGGRIVAVGTTTVRVLESAVRNGELEAGTGETDLYLTPGAAFQVVDVLLTNFHMPRSTLLMLVSAFAGHERILDLYREAVARRYRFFSYGDAMLLARR